MQALARGFFLAGHYQIHQVLGAGGFGITYLAEDTQLGMRVAIKEFFPGEFVARSADGALAVRDGHSGELFQWGLGRFLEEARSLARFSHPALVSVLRIFEANNTAYMVLRFEDGQSLKSMIDGLGQPLMEAEIRAVIYPVLDGLAVVHAQHMLHLDIAPDNIIIRPDGRGLLIDFGAARRAIADRRQTLISSVREGYSPPEQYTTGRHQGPWTDIYALGAVLYYAVTGHRPMSSLERILDDRLVPASTAAEGRFSPHLLRSIDLALRLKIAERPQSIAAFRAHMVRESVPPNVHWQSADMILGDRYSSPLPSLKVGSPARQESPQSSAPMSVSVPSYTAQTSESHPSERPSRRRRLDPTSTKDPTEPQSPERLAQRHRSLRAVDADRSRDAAAASVFAPAFMRARTRALIQVFLHAPQDAGRAATLATAIDPERGRQITQDLDLPLKLGDNVEVVLEPDGLRLMRGSERRQQITWTGQPKSVDFVVQAPWSLLGRDLRPVVRLAVEGTSIGRIAFRINVSVFGKAPEPIFTGEARRYRRAFLSYSSVDRAEVLKRAQAFRAAGMEIFQDVLDLEPGDRWGPRLIEEINKSDVFYLFWSHSARTSPWVRKEARQAVRRQKTTTARAPDIIPIVLEQPSPLPPRFLKHLHFNDPIAPVIAQQARQSPT
ncbi:MAG: protein kinase domain-containing protein [Hyphomicrobiaceae bacterium]